MKVKIRRKYYFPDSLRTPGHRVIRQVVWVDSNGRPKIAVDRKAQLQLERVVARSYRECSYHGCQLGPILAGTAYAKATNRDPEKADGPVIGGRRLQRTFDFHFECVWPEARPLVRFLRPREDAS